MVRSPPCREWVVSVTCEEGRQANPPPRPRLNRSMWVGSFGWPRTTCRLFYPGWRPGNIRMCRKLRADRESVWLRCVAAALEFLRANNISVYSCLLCVKSNNNNHRDFFCALHLEIYHLAIKIVWGRIKVYECHILELCSELHVTLHDWMPIWSLSFFDGAWVFWRIHFYFIL